MWDTTGHSSTYSVYRNSGGGFYAGAGSNTTALNGVRFSSSSGNIAAGIFNLYGVKK